jgi:hypothetical protein
MKSGTEVRLEMIRIIAVMTTTIQKKKAQRSAKAPTVTRKFENKRDQLQFADNTRTTRRYPP